MRGGQLLDEHMGFSNQVEHEARPDSWRKSMATACIPRCNICQGMLTPARFRECRAPGRAGRARGARP